MEMVRWDDSLSVQIEEIDEQHKQLLGLMNDLFDAMKKGEGRSVLEKTLDGLLEYTEYHFSAEEKYMREFDYDEYEQHKNEHDALREEVLHYRNQLTSDRVTLDLLGFLWNWIQTHVKQTDKRYAPFFQEKGLK